MAGKREERKKARFHWLVTSWLIVAAVIIVGVGGIILFMNGLYHKEMRKENAQLPQMLESSRDAKWAYAFNGESQTESESQSESQLESDSQSESELQLESTEEDLYLLKKKYNADIRAVLPASKILILRKAEEKFNRKLLQQFKEKRNKGKL